MLCNMYPKTPWSMVMQVLICFYCNSNNRSKGVNIFMDFLLESNKNLNYQRSGGLRLHVAHQKSLVLMSTILKRQKLGLSSLWCLSLANRQFEYKQLPCQFINLWITPIYYCLWRVNENNNANQNKILEGSRRITYQNLNNSF